MNYRLIYYAYEEIDATKGGINTSSMVQLLLAMANFLLNIIILLFVNRVRETI